MRIRDVIIADSTGKEKGFLDETIQLDLEIGETNDFEMQLALSDYLRLEYEIGDRIYIPGTEYGGFIEEIETSSYEDSVFLRGYTWRGLLEQKVICLSEGQESKTVSGDANRIIGEMIEGWFDNLVYAEEEESGIQIESFEIEGYSVALTAITEMLKTGNARLEIVYEQQKNSGRVVLRAVRAEDYSKDIEYSNDHKVHFTTKDSRKGINHLICIGEDEAENPIQIHLYMDEEGKIGESQTYQGVKERMAVLEITGKKERAEIIEEGTKKLKELGDYQELNMTVQDIEVAVGDIVGGRERITGLYMQQPVTGKILNLSNSNESIEYKVGE